MLSQAASTPDTWASSCSAPLDFYHHGLALALDDGIAESTSEIYMLPSDVTAPLDQARSSGTQLDANNFIEASENHVSPAQMERDNGEILRFTPLTLE